MNSRLVTGFIVAALVALAQANVSMQSPAEGFDLVAAENGGRVESVTSQFSGQGANAMNVITANTKYPWFTLTSGLEQHELVLSFFSRQSALFGSVLINPMTPTTNDRPKDIEIWTSTESPATGFAKVASATLKKEDSLQPIAFTPVEAKFIKIRIVATYGPGDDGKPGAPLAMSRVKVIEGQRAGYQSILARNPELAAIAKGQFPAAPADAAQPAPPPQGPASCPVPRAEPRKASGFPQSKEVLVVADDPGAYRTVSWKSSATDTRGTESTRLVVPGVNYSWITAEGVSPAHLIASPKIDTIVFAQVCEINDKLSPAFKQALLAWVAAGHKMIIQDSDFCGPARQPKYPFIPYPFATVNPGATASQGEAGIIENSTLANADKDNVAFVDADGWKSGPNDLGDSNIVVQYDARWCGAMWAKNRLQKSGLALAYAHYGRGLMIYDGFDADQATNKSYRQLQMRELLQSFDADYLPCSQPIANFLVTSNPNLKTQFMAAGKTYAYPVLVRGNYGFSGTVTLDASVTPADAGVTVSIDKTSADLTTLDEATSTLTVTTAPGASLASKVVAVRGTDKTGKTNVLCLDLTERTTGNISVTSLLQQEKKPTKNLEIILDASGSMKLPLGSRTRWTTAQAVLKDVVSKLPPDFNVGLRAYGHTLPSTNPGTCKDTALIVPVGQLKPADFLASAGKLAPRGETPLVYSILQTPNDLKPLGGGTVILITDGEESCKGDFAAAAKTLKENGLNLTLNIVGFTLKNAPAQAQLSGLAESTGGHYFGAQNGDALSRAVLLAALDRLPYRILDSAGKEVAKGEAGTGKGHELPPGNYRVVITAADQDTTTPVALAVGQDVQLRASVKADKLVVDR